MPIQGTRLAIGRHIFRIDTGYGAHMLDDGGRSVIHHRKVAQALECLQQQQQAEARLWLARNNPREMYLLVSRRVERASSRIDGLRLKRG